MMTFSIQSIEQGWFDFSIGNFYFSASNYLGYDFPLELVLLLYRIAKGEQKAGYICLQDEPGSCLLYLSCKGKSCDITIYQAKKEAHKINISAMELEETDGVDFEQSVNFLSFSREVVYEMMHYAREHGIEEYEKHWMRYPTVAIEELKNLVGDISKRTDR